MTVPELEERDLNLVRWLRSKRISNDRAIELVVQVRDILANSPDSTDWYSKRLPSDTKPLISSLRRLVRTIDRVDEGCKGYLERLGMDLDGLKIYGEAVLADLLFEIELVKARAVGGPQRIESTLITTKISCRWRRVIGREPSTHPDAQFRQFILELNSQFDLDLPVSFMSLTQIYERMYRVAKETNLRNERKRGKP